MIGADRADKAYQGALSHRIGARARGAGAVLPLAARLGRSNFERDA